MIIFMHFISFQQKQSVKIIKIKINRIILQQNQNLPEINMIKNKQ